jgi:RNA polymerase sigma-70 factor (ECF subfamily)
VAHALASLPEAQREALEFQHWHGWTLAEIGAHMGKSRAAVAGLIKRGVEQLRKKMKDEHP